MATTIQVPESLKAELDRLKTRSTMSYAELLAELVKQEKRRRQDLSFREYGAKYGEESRKEVNEWKDRWQE